MVFNISISMQFLKTFKDYYFPYNNSIIMNKAIILNLTGRFVHTKNEFRVYSPWHTFSYNKFETYLSVFKEVILVIRSKETLKHLQGHYEVTGKGITVCFIPYYEGPWLFLSNYMKIRRRIKLLLESYPDAAISVILPCPIGFTILDLIKRTRHYGVEVIADPWTAFSLNSIRHVLSPFLRYHYTFKLKRACKNAFAVRYVTQDALQKRYPTSGREFVASNVSISESDFSPFPKLHKDNKTYRLVFVGSLNQLYKGPDVLIKSLSLCIKNGLNLRLAILGGGKYENHLKLLAKSMGVEKNIEFTGMVTRDKVFEYLDQSDLFVLPSKTEGLPRALIEAMARGLPCIATNVGGIPELLGEEAMVPPNDIKALASKITEILTNACLYNSLAIRNLTKAKEYISHLQYKKYREYLEYLLLSSNSLVN